MNRGTTAQQSIDEAIRWMLAAHGRIVLASKHLFDQADFLAYRSRILDERRRAWIGS